MKEALMSLLVYAYEKQDIMSSEGIHFNVYFAFISAK